MKRITIDIYEKGDRELRDLIDINSIEMSLNYSETLYMQGLQCNFNGDTKEYKEIENTLEHITKLIRKLNKIYK